MDILLIENNDTIKNIVNTEFEDNIIHIDNVYSYRTLTKAINEIPANSDIDIILYEPNMLDESHQNKLISFNQQTVIPIILIVDETYTDQAINLIKYGVDSFILQSTITPNLLQQTIINAIARNEIRVNLRRKEQILQNRSDQFNSIFNKNPLAIVMLDENGSIREANSKYLNLLGYDKTEELIGKSIYKLTYNEDITKSKLFLEDILTNPDRTYSFEKRYLKKDGSPIWCNITVFTINVQEELIIVDIIRDISKEKQNEIIMEEQRKEIETAQLMESYGLLASGIAHDFNNILTTIRGYTELAQNLHDSEKLSKYTGNVIDAVDKATKLTESLLIFSGDKSRQNEVVEVNSIISGMKTILNTVGSYIDLQINDSSTDLVIYFNKHLLEQIILNLVINARDAVDSTGLITISTKLIEITEMEGLAFKENQYVAISVEDNGVGIAEKDLIRIFEPFYTTKEPGKGSGLGLTNVKRIVESNDGIIEVESKLNEGSKFTIYFPEYSGSKLATYRTRETKDTTFVPLTSKNILLIEDNPSVKNVLNEQLTLMNATVFTANNGSEGLDILLDPKKEIDLIITDIQMPVMNGTEFIKMVQRHDKNIPIIVISANVEFNADDYDHPISFLTKPFSIDTLMHIISEMMK